jgi:4-diphosphocytidyl-2-C-methyl-D-erythritol kinase
MVLFANAKINFGLEVLGKRHDGLHLIRSLFVPVPIFDKITVKPSDKLHFKGVFGRKNICYKAAEKFFEISKIKGSATISLMKKIPIGAGLGGGSSDAASVLRALNKLYETNYSPQKLAKIAAEVGSDVPFFIYNKPSLVEGVGEKISPLPSSDDSKNTSLKQNLSTQILPLTKRFLVITPNIDCDTKAVYKRFDETPELPLIPQYPYNALTSAAFSVYPALETFYNWLNNLLNVPAPGKRGATTAPAQNQAIFTTLSGSGSSIVVSFADTRNGSASYQQCSHRLQYCIDARPCDYKIYDGHPHRSMSAKAEIYP